MAPSLLSVPVFIRQPVSRLAGIHIQQRVTPGALKIVKRAEHGPVTARDVGVQLIFGLDQFFRARGNFQQTPGRYFQSGHGASVLLLPDGACYGSLGVSGERLLVRLHHFSSRVQAEQFPISRDPLPFVTGQIRVGLRPLAMHRQYPFLGGFVFFGVFFIFSLLDRFSLTSILQASGMSQAD